MPPEARTALLEALRREWAALWEVIGIAEKAEDEWTTGMVKQAVRRAEEIRPVIEQMERETGES